MPLARSSGTSERVISCLGTMILMCVCMTKIGPSSRCVSVCNNNFDPFNTNFVRKYGETRLNSYCEEYDRDLCHEWLGALEERTVDGWVGNSGRRCVVRVSGKALVAARMCCSGRVVLQFCLIARLPRCHLDPRGLVRSI